MSIFVSLQRTKVRYEHSDKGIKWKLYFWPKWYVWHTVRDVEQKVNSYYSSIECFLFEYWAGNLWGVHFCMKTKRHPLFSSQYFLVLTTTKQFRATGFSSHFSHLLFHSLFGFHTKTVCPIHPRETVEFLHKKYGFLKKCFTGIW